MTTDPIVDYFLADSAGRIVATGKTRLSRVAQQERPGVTAHLGLAAESQWYDRDADQLVAREAFSYSVTDAEIRADGVETARVLGVPAGATCWMAGPQFVGPEVHQGGDIEIRTMVAGEYVLHVDHPRHTPVQIQVRAVAP